MTKLDDLKWWQKAVFYQIYPRCFADGNGDGIGDLRGIIDKLPYLENLGIEAIWLSPHYPSPLYDCGYDIADYTDVAPEYGRLADFQRFLIKRECMVGKAGFQHVQYRFGRNDIRQPDNNAQHADIENNGPSDPVHYGLEHGEFFLPGIDLAMKADMARIGYQ